MSVNLIRGNRLNSFIIHDGNGFYYHKSKFKCNTSYLRCVQQSCPGRANCKGPLSEGMTIFSTSNHIHDSNKTLAEVRKLKLKLKERSAKEPKSLKKIYEEEISSVSTNVLEEIGFAEVESSMYKSRRAANPHVPTTLAEYGQIMVEDVAGRYSKTLNGEQFFRCSINGEDVGTSIVFVSPYFIQKFIEKPSEIHIDGTFKVLPRVPKCYQMVTILSVHYQQVFPMVYILMERKTREAYEIAFSFFKALLRDATIGTVITDFESGIQIAARRVFEGAEVHGCWFHFASALFHKARKQGLYRNRMTKKIIRKLIQMAMALPLLPPQLMEAGFEFLDSFAADKGIKAIVQPFLNYLNRTWITGVGPVTLSVFKQTNRTNNFHESLHMAMKRKLGVHPPIWVFTDCLRKEEDLHRRQYISLVAGRRTVRSRTKANVAKDSHIRKAEQNLERNGNVGEFLSVTAKRLTVMENGEEENEADENDPEEEIIQVIDAVGAVEDSTSEENTSSEVDDPFKGKCVVCKDAETSHACIPCGHLALCKICATTLQTFSNSTYQELTCPLCNAPATNGIFQVFFS